MERDHQVAVGAAFHVETTFLWESIFFFWVLQCESISILNTFKQFHQQPYNYHNHKQHHHHNTTNFAIPDQLLVSLLKAWLCECRFCVFFSHYCAFIPSRAFSACATYSRWLRHKVTTAGRFVASASLWWWIHKPLLFANLWKVLKFLKRGGEVKMECL